MREYTRDSSPEGWGCKMDRDEVRLLRWQGPPRTNLGSDTNSAGHRVGEPG